jgi:hypothetical protein
MLSKDGPNSADSTAPVIASNAVRRSHIDTAVLIAIVPVVVAAVRIWLFSGGDTAVFLTLLRTLNIPAVLIGTIIVAVPFVIILMLTILVTDWKARDQAKEWLSRRHWPAALIPILFFIFLYTTSWTILISLATLGAFVGAYTLTRRYWPWGRKYIADIMIPRRGDHNGPVSIVTFTGVLVVFLIIPTSMWLPLEKIDIDKSESRAAYVLESTQEWTTLLTSKYKIEVYHTKDIKSRAVCRSSFGGSLSTLIYQRVDHSGAPDCK